RCGGANGREEVRVDQFARGRALADAQGRGDDGAGSEESIGAKTLCGRRRRRRQSTPPNLPFLGEVSELWRPWAIQHEDRGALLARPSEWILSAACFGCLPQGNVFHLWVAAAPSFRWAWVVAAFLRGF